MEAKRKQLGIGKTSEVFLEKYCLTRVLESWVEIHATIDEAWDALVDFASWTQWNSFIPVVTGELAVGNEMTIRVKPPGLKEMVFKPTVYEMDIGSKLVWGGVARRIGYRGIHEFVLEYIEEDKTRFIQREKFEGPIVLLMSRMIHKTALGYVNMNEEFKEYIEKNREYL